MRSALFWDVTQPGMTVYYRNLEQPIRPIFKGQAVCSRSFSIVIRFAGFCYGRFMIMRYKFNLATYVQGPLVIDRTGCTERNLNEITAGN